MKELYSEHLFSENTILVLSKISSRTQWYMAALKTATHFFMSFNLYQRKKTGIKGS